VLDFILRRNRPTRVDVLGCARVVDPASSVIEVDLLWRARVDSALQRSGMVISDSRLKPTCGEYVLRFDCVPG